MTKNAKPAFLQRQSPFYSRVYGSYSRAQEVFYRSYIGTVRGCKVLDPMGGQGYALSTLAWEGADVHIGDLSPAPLLLGFLRSPNVMRHARRLASTTRRKLVKLGKRRSIVKRFCDDWIPDSIKEDLYRYMDIFALERYGNPFETASRFWDAPLEARFAACLPIIAAREYVCFRTSDNCTWNKKGGLQRVHSIREPLLNALDLWEREAARTVAHYQNGAVGNLRIETIDVTSDQTRRLGAYDMIITSPPYANRMDYSQFWAPELETLCAMYEYQSHALKTEQIGSTVVHGKLASISELKRLPVAIKRALDNIRTAPEPYSENYYYPFFAEYAVSLSRAIRNVCHHLRIGGKLIVFVRDTHRKDVLFETGLLVRCVVESVPGMRNLTRTHPPRVVRSHVGLLGRNTTRPSLHGLAQREWWLAFERAKV